MTEPDAAQPTGLKGMLRAEAKDALIFTASNLLNRVGGFFLLPLYWQRLAPEDFGVVAVIAVVGSFQTLFGMSLDLAVTTYYYRWPEAERRRNLGALWMWNWIITLAGGALFAFVVPLWSDVVFRGVTREDLVLGIIGNALLGLAVIPSAAIRILRLPWMFAVYNLFSFVVTAGLGVYFVMFRDEGLHGFLVSTIAANALIAVLSVVYMLRFSTPALASAGLREAFRFAVPAIPSGLISAAGSILDRVLLNHYASLHTLGVYAVAMKFVDVIGSLHASLKMSFGPFMMKRITEDREAGSRAVVAMIPFYLLPYFAAGLGLVLFIGPMVRLIDQPAYYDIVTWVPWLVGITLLGCLSFYYTNGILLGNRTDLLSFPAAARLIVMVVAGFLMIRAYQMDGLIVSLYLSATVFLVLSIYLSQQAFHLPHRWDKLFALIVTTVVFAVLGSLLTLENLPLEIAVKTLVYLGFGGVVYLMIPREAA